MSRTGYSFHVAIGHIDEVVSRLVEIGSTTAVIADRCSTFGFNNFSKAAKKASLRIIYGVELAVVPELGAAKPIVDYVQFWSIDSITPLNELIGLATANPGKEPSLLYREALETPGLIKIFGERARVEHIVPAPDVFVGLSPAVSRGFYNSVNRAGLNWIATDSNFYPRESDQELYRVMLGRRAETRTYPGHILTDKEWLKSVNYFASEKDIAAAIENRERALASCQAKLKTAEIFVPEKPKTLREMCVEGAKRLNVDLTNPVYAQRLDHELNMIASKNFEDYFYIIADLITFAKSVMIVGPARGSSCGSLACYLLNITTIDPLPYGLIFERFIDVNRADLPDIDIDFSDVNRHLVFEYAEQKYGRDHVARLGTVGMFQPTSAMNQAGLALRIPKFKIQKTLEGVIERSSGDSRANNSLEDTLKETPGGIALLKEFPEVIMAARMEGHPNNSGQHAAGIVITKEKVTEVVAIDSRTGATMCDKYDAEDFKLLKIDALGLTQLSVQERTLELIGETPTSDGGFLDKIPLDDPLAFEIINNQRWAGIFQYTGSALQSLAKQFKSDNINDIVSVTALARPGPLASGGANEWVKRRNGDKPVTYPHPIFEPMLSDSLGMVIYQETVLRIGREVGNLSWEDVTLLRKAMSKSLGKEFFSQFGDRWIPVAISKGVPPHVAEKMFDDMTAFGSWAFNKAHAVAYGMISYQCCWLKAHYPLEFAAATLDAESEPAKQLAFLRELKEDGIDYVPVDPEHSTDRWTPIRKDNTAYLVGPLSAIRGVGPKTVDAIMVARRNGQALPAKLAKKLENAKTQLDSLYPVSDRYMQLLPHPRMRGVNHIMRIKDVVPGVEGYVTIVGIATRIAPRDDNDLANIAKRNGKRVSGPSMALNMFFRDDSDEIFVRITRFDFERLAKDIIELGRPGKVMYAVRGVVPPDFRMIRVTDIVHLGEIDSDIRGRSMRTNPSDKQLDINVPQPRRISGDKSEKKRDVRESEV